MESWYEMNDKLAEGLRWPSKPSESDAFQGKI